MINQMGSGFDHPPGITRGTDAPTFTGIGDEEVVSTTGTPRPGKPMGHNTAFQILLAEILFNVGGNRGTLVSACRQPASQLSR